MKEKELLKKEISHFIKSKIFNNFTYNDGIEITDLPVIIMELYGYGFKLIKIKTKDWKGQFHEYRWQDYGSVFRSEWVVPVVDEITFMDEPKSYITVSIKKSEFEEIEFQSKYNLNDQHS